MSKKSVLIINHISWSNWLISTFTWPVGYEKQENHCKSPNNVVINDHKKLNVAHFVARRLRFQNINIKQLKKQIFQIFEKFIQFENCRCQHVYFFAKNIFSNFFNIWWTFQKYIVVWVLFKCVLKYWLKYMT